MIWVRKVGLISGTEESIVEASDITTSRADEGEEFGPPDPLS